jgi:putative ABC transport system substrate-binding protein
VVTCGGGPAAIGSDAAIEYSIAGKWLELLKQISPRSIHVAVISNPTNPTAAGYLRVIDAAAPTFACG